MLKALLWDVDGTLAETERDGHLVAFNQAFEALNVSWRWTAEQYAQLLSVAGGRERLLHDMQFQEHAPTEPEERAQLADHLHRVKNEFYANVVRSGALPLREGVSELLDDCHRCELPMGIVTTTSRSNVDALLATHLGKDWESRFATVVSADEAPRKKPDPQAYLFALDALQVRAHECVAMEDAPAGITAAQSLGVPLIVTRSYFFPFARVQGALAAGPSLGRCDGWQPAAAAGAARIGLDQIARWYTQRNIGLS